MPFQPINYANIAPIGSPFLRDFVETLTSGYKAGQLPSQLARQKEKEQLANAMQSLLVEEQPQKFSEESQERQLKNAFQSLLNQEQPQKFNSEMSSADVLRAFQRAQTGKLNTMTPLEAQELALKNALYPELTKSMIESNKALATFRQSGGSGVGAGGKYERDFQNFVAKDNPQLSPDEIYEASNVLREGGDTLENGTKLNPLSPATQGALDRVIKSGTTPTVTANKKVIQAIDNVMPLISELKEMHEPGQFVGKYTSPNQQAKYLSKVNEIKDSLAAALKLPQTNEGIKVIETIVGRHPFETSNAYHNRLIELEKDLQMRRKKSILNAGSPLKSSTSSGNIEEEGIIDGRPVVKTNGKWHYK